VRRASGLVLVLTGLAATTYVSLQTDTDEVPSYRLQHVETRPNGIASAGETTEPLPTLPVPVVVTIAQPQIRPALPPKPRTLIPTGRAAIGRQLQRELKRVGCYDGNLNGEWTRPTRQAMNAFIDRVNAKLPTNVPDGILLALVQAYDDKVCGRRCPPDQGLSDTGVCLPNVILARTKGAKSVSIAQSSPAGRATSAVIGWTATETGTTVLPPAETPPTENKMALAGPSSPAVATAMPKAARAAQKRQSQYSEHQGSWARNLFRQSDKLGVN
jgi:hypothetical protein